MSNTSDQTTKPSKKTRLIIGEVGVDTETGIVGKGHSYDNGRTFTVDDTIYGRIYHDDDHGKIWQGIQDKVKTVVEPAKSAADSAVAYANDAVEKSKVNSQAIDDINSAVSDAKQGANDAMIRAKSAWDVATGAKEAVTDFDPLLKQAQSDAKAAGGSAAVLRTDVDKVTSLVNDPKTGLNATYQTASGNATTISNVKSDVYQLETTANGLTSRVGNLESKTNTQETAIEQNKNAITLKADQTNVDTLKGTVNQLQSSLSVQAGQIQTKVSASDVSGMLTGYATQSYAQSLVTQKADEWNVNLTKLKNDTQTSLTNLAVGVEGVQAQVYNSDGSSKITQLSSLIAAKVSQGDYNSQITQLKNDINLRVSKGDLISQINLQAGTALIQSNKLVLDGKTTIITGEAFIPSAAIGSIQADKVMLGSTSLYNSDGTMNLVNTKDGTTSKITVTQGNVDFDGVNKTASIIRFASDNNTNAFTVNPTGATVTPTLFFERFDQPPGHWLGFTRNETEHEGVMFHTWDDDGERFFVDCHARFDKNLRTIGTLSQGSWDGINGRRGAGVLTMKSGSTIWSGSDYRAIGTNLTGSYGNVMARSFSQQSTLSSKTNIETVDPKDALDLVNKTDIRSYQYKSDVAQGHTKRYTSLIIDDVNDVSKYYAPDEFTNEERTGRDDGSAVGYLFLAVKELTRRIKTLEEKLNG